MSEDEKKDEAKEAEKIEAETERLRVIYGAFEATSSSTSYRTIRGIAREVGVSDEAVRKYIDANPAYFEVGPVHPSGSLLYGPSTIGLETMSSRITVGGKGGAVASLTTVRKPPAAPYPTGLLSFLGHAHRATESATEAEGPERRELCTAAAAWLDRFVELQRNFDSASVPHGTKALVTKALVYLRAFDSLEALVVLDDLYVQFEQYLGPST